MLERAKDNLPMTLPKVKFQCSSSHGVMQAHDLKQVQYNLEK